MQDDGLIAAEEDNDTELKDDGLQPAVDDIDVDDVVERDSEHETDGDAVIDTVAVADSDAEPEDDCVTVSGHTHINNMRRSIASENYIIICKWHDDAHHALLRNASYN